MIPLIKTHEPKTSNTTIMKNLIIALFITTGLLACSDSGSKLEQKQKELTEKKKEYSKLKDEIDKLETEIAKLDTTEEDLGIAVKIDTVVKSDFNNPVVFQGLVESDKNVLINPEVPSTVTAIHVREGQRVYKGQLLVSLDGRAAQSQIAELEARMELAKANYDKQKRLWDQNIGSEIQFIQAKTNYEALQKSMMAAQVQLGKFDLRSPISGTVDDIMAKVGQLVGSLGSQGVMRVVNLQDVEIKANISERYLENIKKGQPVEVFYPSLNLTTKERVSAIGSVIDPNNRTFSIIIEPSMKSNMLKPNLLALITANDYVKEDAITVPTRLIRNDGKGDYVLTVNQDDLTVVKSFIEIEEQFATESVISSGLKEGALLITEGYNSVIKGDPVKIIPSK